MTAWPLKDPPHVAVIIDRDILHKGTPVCLVSHVDYDGAWQFHTNERTELRVKDGAVIGLGEMLARDPSLAQLADLPLGWRAWRPSEDAPWQRMKVVSE